jgi:hypothetical protein
MNEPIWIDLSETEMIHAALVGALRHWDSITNERVDAYGCEGEDNSLARHINGAGGELAVAKLSGKYWGGHIGTFKGSDIGRGVQVRTRSRHDWDLIVREHEADDQAFVLVTGQAPHFAVRGWIMGADAKSPAWLKAHGGRPPAFFVPQSALRPLIKDLAA